MRRIFSNLLLALAYFATGYLGLTLAYEQKFISLVWPPSGIALAFVFLQGYGMIPGVFLGAFAVSYVVGFSIPISLGIAIGNTLGIFFATALLRLAGFRKEMDCIRDVIALVVLAAWMAMAVTATIGVTTLVQTESLALSDFAEAWSRWWLGDVMGIVVISPLLFFLSGRPSLPKNAEKQAEAAILAALIFFVTHLTMKDVGRPYFIFPLLFWAASRFGRGGATLSAFTISALAIWYTTQGHGPFVRETVEESLIAAQSFMGITTVTGLAIAAGLCERRRAEDRRIRLAESEAVLNRLKFLEEASTILSSSLNFETTLGNIVRLVVPGLADYCIIGRGFSDGNVPYIRAAHRDPVKQREVISRLVRKIPRLETGHPAAVAFFEAHSVLVPVLTREMIEHMANDEEHLQILRELKPISYIAVPLLGPHYERNPAVIVLCRTTESGLHYNQTDLALAEELARRCAGAIERAELYEAAQNAIRVREDTIAVVSHDLKNPVAAILLGTRLVERVLRKETLSEEGKQRVFRSLQHVLRSAERCYVLIQNLLDAARIASGSFQVEKEIVPVREQIEEAVNLLRPAATEKEIRIDIHIPKYVRFLHCDRTKLYQVFANLVGNAIKYIQNGGKIDILAEDRGEEILFIVKDNGPGIPPEELAHIFERFRQRSRKVVGGGTGLGLSIVKGIVAAHGGRVWVESEVGRGSKFCFTLPKPKTETIPWQEAA